MKFQFMFFSAYIYIMALPTSFPGSLPGIGRGEILGTSLWHKAVISGLEENFSNALIIQKTKTKEIMHRDVFGYLMKNSLFLPPYFPSKISLFAKSQTRVTAGFITISKTSKFIKNTPLRVEFSTLFSVFDM